jgi:hypothetical protein
MTLEQVADELAELRKDIHALAIIEIYHASGRIQPPQSTGTPVSASEMESYNQSMHRLNERYHR